MQFWDHNQCNVIHTISYRFRLEDIKEKNGDLHRKLFKTSEISILIYPGEEHFFFLEKEEQLKPDKQDSKPSPSKLTYDALLTN